MEDHVKRELGCEEGEKPLRCVHMSLQTHIQEMVVQVWYIFLLKTERKRGTEKDHKEKKLKYSTGRKRRKRNDAERGKLIDVIKKKVKHRKEKNATQTHTPA